MARRLTQDDKPAGNAPWMNTYADMVTLLLCFFVLLFSMSSVSERKFQTALGSLQGAFGILEGAEPSIMTPNQGSMTANQAELSLIVMELARLEVIGDAFRKQLEREGMAGKVSVELEERGLLLRFADSVLFDVGSAELREEARDVLVKVGEFLNTIDNQIRVEGHTDNWPIDTPQFPSNWELSASRATRVVRFLEDVCKVSPVRLQAAGYGEHRPIAGNDSEEGRQRNRRIDVMILRSSLSSSEPKVDITK